MFVVLEKTRGCGFVYPLSNERRGAPFAVSFVLNGRGQAATIQAHLVRVGLSSARGAIICVIPVR